MARITVRFFIDDNEVDRLDADLPSEADARETIAACKQCVEEMEPPSAEEAAEDAKAWAVFRKQLEEQRESLAERMRKERER